MVYLTTMGMLRFLSVHFFGFKGGLNILKFGWTESPTVHSLSANNYEFWGKKMKRKKRDKERRRGEGKERRKG